MKPGIVGLAACLLMTAAAAGEPPPADWAPNEVIEVVHQAPGPAFWHVQKGDSEIWILGTAGPLVSGTKYNLDHISEIIKGARAVLLPPSASSGLFSAGWFLLTHRGLLSMPDGKKLEDTLEPGLKARFIAARTALKLGPEKFNDDPPILTAVYLSQEFNKAHKLAGDNSVLSDVKKLARQHDVAVKSIGDYEALDLIKELLRLPQERQQKCLADAVQYTEQAGEHAAALSDAWAAGDVKSIKAHYIERPMRGCMELAVSFRKIKDHAVADYVKVIHQALSQPGKVLLLANIGDLLRASGVAEVLHKEGVTIEGPAE